MSLISNELRKKERTARQYSFVGSDGEEVDPLADEPDPEPPPDSSIEKQQLWIKILELNKDDPQAQDVLTAYELGYLTPAAASEMTGYPVKDVKNILKRIRRRIGGLKGDLI